MSSAHLAQKREFRISPEFDPGKGRITLITLVKKLVAIDADCVARMQTLDQLGKDHKVDFLDLGFFAGRLVSTLLKDGASSGRILVLGKFHFPPDTVNPEQGSFEVSKCRTGWTNQSMNHLFKTIHLWYLWNLENKEKVCFTAAEKTAFFDYFVGINRLPVLYKAKDTS
jgi:hypothetical protein